MSKKPGRESRKKRAQPPRPPRKSRPEPPAPPLAEHPFVVGYLEELDEVLTEASPSQREEMRARAEAEFERRLAHVPEPTDKQILEVSVALGRPRDVAEAAGLVSVKPAPSRGEQVLRRAPVLLGVAGVILTFYSSITAAVLGVGALVVLVRAIPRWKQLKNTIVVGGILVVAIALILAVQLLGAS